MNPTELEEFVRLWIIDELGDPEIPVIFAYPGAPAPVQRPATYMAVEANALWRPLGQRTEGANTGVDRAVTTDYEVTIVIWECRGTGALLLNLVGGFSKFSTRSRFSDSGISILRQGNISKVPSLQDKAMWDINHRLEIFLGMALAAQDDVPAISGVGIEGTVAVDGDPEEVDVQIVVTTPP